MFDNFITLNFDSKLLSDNRVYLIIDPKIAAGDIFRFPASL